MTTKFGYCFDWDEDCSIGVYGYATPERAMWAAAREVYRCTKRNLLTAREFRRILTGEERKTLCSVARLKLTAQRSPTHST